MSVLKQIENWLESVLSKLGIWIKPQMNAAAVIYNNLSKDEKEAAHIAYSIVATVNNNAEDITLVMPALNKLFPSLTENMVQGFVEKTLLELKILKEGQPITLDEALTELAFYLKSLNGSVWAQISQAIGNILFVFLSPSTPVQKAVAIAEYVYQTFVKPNL